MARARNGDIELEYETFGDSSLPTLLIVSGLGSQMTGVAQGFCERLVERGFHVIRFDNRDVGLSTWTETPYTARDMVRDALAVLDAAGVGRAHIVGVSMGGIVVQRLAIDHGERVLSLTSIMSTPGGSYLVSTPEVAASRQVAPPNPAEDFEGFLAHAVRSARSLGSPAYPTPEAEIRERAIATYRRAYNPAGVQRQLAAVRADGDRVRELRGLKMPALVIHGADDPLVRPIGGEATADAIPGAELKIIPGMGHDMPAALHALYADAIAAIAARAGPV